MKITRPCIKKSMIIFLLTVLVLTIPLISTGCKKEATVNVELEKA